MDAEGCAVAILSVLVALLVGGVLGYNLAGYDYRALQVEYGKGQFDVRTGVFLEKERGQ